MLPHPNNLIKRQFPTGRWETFSLVNEMSCVLISFHFISSYPHISHTPKVRAQWALRQQGALKDILSITFIKIRKRRRLQILGL